MAGAVPHAPAGTAIEALAPPLEAYSSPWPQVDLVSGASDWGAPEVAGACAAALLKPLQVETGEPDSLRHGRHQETLPAAGTIREEACTSAADGAATAPTRAAGVRAHPAAQEKWSISSGSATVGIKVSVCSAR